MNKPKNWKVKRDLLFLSRVVAFLYVLAVGHMVWPTLVVWYKVLADSPILAVFVLIALWFVAIIGMMMMFGEDPFPKRVDYNTLIEKEKEERDEEETIEAS